MGGETYINPLMVTLARESRGLTQPELAKMLSVNQGWLSRVEAGLRGIQNEYLQRLSNILNYPATFFTRREQVYGLGVTSLFHRKLQSVSNKRLKKIHAQIYLRSLEICKLLQGIDINGTNKIPLINLEDYDGDAEEIARIVRASWHIPSGPIPNLISVIESVKGIVIPFDFETSEIDAISHYPPYTPPLFFINKYNPTDRLRFTLCHELGHVIMHQNSLDVTNMEHQAHKFAAEFLMPKRDIRHQLIDLNLEKLMILKQYWKVSMGALLKRAGDLGVITPRKYRDLWMAMGKAGYRMREPAELDIPAEKPTLLGEILSAYINEMDYSTLELGMLLCLTENEVNELYINTEQVKLEKEKRLAIKEVERLLNKPKEEK